MDKLIKASLLLEDIDPDGTRNLDPIEVRSIIVQQPAVNAVEVVRCRDCIKRNTPDCAMWYQCSICGGQWSWETDDVFCSFGERNSGNIETD